MSAAADSNPPGELYCTACEKTFHIGDRCPTDGTRLLRLKARIDPFLGRELDGRYTVLEKLGSGGMGAVYRAEQHSVDREVAIKVVNSSLVSEPEVIKRFLREAKLATRLSHPNAVTVLDFGQTDDGVFFLVMELVAGRTLDDVIKAERQFKPERVVRIGIQICDALEGAHELSIIHRDLKPSNIMLMSTGRDFVKVLDFGLAKSTSPDQTSTTMTGAGAVVGTPAFMPPELAMGEPCDARSDLYSLGVILYLLGSGRLPFMSESVHELLSMHASDEPAPPVTGVPQRLARVIDKLLAKKPADRYQNAIEARTALEEALIVATPSPSLAQIPDDTKPSIGPFPATTAQFAGLQTPLPPSIVAERTHARPDQTPARPRASTELDRMMRGETMLAGNGSPAPAQPHPDVSSPGFDPPKKKRWPLVAGAAAVLGAGAVVFALSMSGKDEPKQAPPPAPAVKQADPPAKQDALPVKQDVVTPPEAKQPEVKQPEVKQPDPPPVVDPKKGKRGTAGKLKTVRQPPPVQNATTTNPPPPNPPPQNLPPQNPPPGGSGVKLPF